MSQFLNLIEMKDYLGIDYDDTATENRLNQLSQVADSYLIGSIGKDFDREDVRAKELGLLVVEDLFDKHGLQETVSGNTRKLVDDISLHLILDMRKGDSSEVSETDSDTTVE